MSCLHKEHPLEKFVDAGLKFCVCTDDLLIFNKSVSEEIYLLAQYHPNTLTKARILQIQLDAIDSSFLKDEGLRESIRQCIAACSD